MADACQIHACCILTALHKIHSDVVCIDFFVLPVVVYKNWAREMYSYGGFVC